MLRSIVKQKGLHLVSRSTQLRSSNGRLVQELTTRRLMGTLPGLMIAWLKDLARTWCQAIAPPMRSLTGEQE